MGKGGNHSETKTGMVESSELGVIPWEEVSKHTGEPKEDPSKWLVIDGQVYDITAWTWKHPGGRKLLSHYAGQDASVSEPENWSEYDESRICGTMCTQTL